jgi:UDP-glucose 4-epimerase
MFATLLSMQPPPVAAEGGRTEWGESRFAVVGGAGFIGSHIVRSLLACPTIESVTVYDNFSSGSESHLEDVRRDAILRVVRVDVDA